MGQDIFSNSTKTVPTSDSQIIRVDMEQQDIGGRKSHLPTKSKNDMTIQHIANSGTKS